MHDETYRMLGREREADLLRAAEKFTRAAELRDRPPAGKRVSWLRALDRRLVRGLWPQPERWFQMRARLSPHALRSWAQRGRVS